MKSRALYLTHKAAFLHYGLGVFIQVKDLNTSSDTSKICVALHWLEASLKVSVCTLSRLKRMLSFQFEFSFHFITKDKACLSQSAVVSRFTSPFLMTIPLILCVNFRLFCEFHGSASMSKCLNKHGHRFRDLSSLWISWMHVVGSVRHSHFWFMIHWLKIFQLFSLSSLWKTAHTWISNTLYWFKQLDLTW